VKLVGESLKVPAVSNESFKGLVTIRVPLVTVPLEFSSPPLKMPIQRDSSLLFFSFYKKGRLSISPPSWDINFLCHSFKGGAQSKELIQQTPPGPLESSEARRDAVPALSA